MTICELSKYHDTKLEIKQLEEVIKDLQNSVISSSKLTDAPRSHSIDSSTEQMALKLIKLKEKLEKKKTLLLDSLDELERFLDTVDDIKVRLIVRKRFIEGKSWQEIGQEIYADRTTPYYKLQRYLKTHP